MNKLIKILFSSLTIYAFVLFFGAWLTLKYESFDINANIKNYYDSLWWSLNATSIGDSNVYPITVNGRIVGVFLILVGYGLFTINVATISSVLNNFVKNTKKKSISEYTEKELELFKEIITSKIDIKKKNKK